MEEEEEEKEEEVGEEELFCLCVFNFICLY